MKSIKRFAILCLSAALAFSLAAPAAAASNSMTIDTPYTDMPASITISGYDSQKLITVSFPTGEQVKNYVFYASSPVRVDFNSEFYAESIQWVSDMQPAPDGSYYQGSNAVVADIQQDVRKIRYEEAQDGLRAHFLPGNYGIIRNAGTYKVMVDSIGMAQCIIVMKGGNSNNQTPALYSEPNLTVDGTDAYSILHNNIAAFNINGNNYMKLRMIAQLVNKTPKQFSVDWDSANSAISLASGKPYTAVGQENAAELVRFTDVLTNTSPVTVYANGKKISLIAYSIYGNNYIKLRDIASAMDFGITWDAASQTVGIDTSKGYNG